MGYKSTLAVSLVGLVSVFQSTVFAQNPCTQQNDNTGPVISNLRASPNTLWPPNHKFVPVQVNYSAADACGGTVTCRVSVTSNEPVNSIGDGNTSPDWIVVNSNNVSLRAERAGPRTGRVYTIRVTCEDKFGNPSVGFTTVRVPHDMGNSMKARVMPNPTKNQFSISIQSTNQRDKISLRLIDVYGKVSESRVGISAGQTIAVGSKLKPGIYQLELIQGREVLKLKVQKQ